MFHWKLDAYPKNKIKFDRIRLYNDDNAKILAKIKENSVDAIFTDPPYGLVKNTDIRQILTSWLNDIDYLHSNKGFMGRCYHPETEVLTEKGWKFINKIAKNDKICSFNPKDEQIEYVKINKIFKYKFNGNLLQIGGRSVLQLVTPNHNVFANNKLIKANALPRTFKLNNQGNWNGLEPDTLVVNGNEYCAKAFLKFFGLWLGDGYSVNRVKHPRKQDFFGLSAKKFRKIKAFREALVSLKIKFTETPSKNGYTVFYIYDKPLRDWLKKFGKSKDKYIPSSFFKLSSQLLENLYRGLIETDGHIQGKQETFCTTSTKLADSFQRLCLHTGRSATLAWIKSKVVIINKVKVKSKGAWRLSVIQKNKSFWMERDKRIRKNGNIQPASVNKIKYNGLVHCINLTKNHILMTRYKGRTVWSGNSWDGCVPGPKIWQECYRVLKPGGYMLVFGGSRTFDLLGISLRLAGFEIRDVFMFLHGMGFPKGQDLGQSIEKKLTLGRARRKDRKLGLSRNRWNGGKEGLAQTGGVIELTQKEAIKWRGWNTQIKPAFEPIILVQKPLTEKNFADNVLKWGVGALNIGACRIPLAKDGEDKRLGGKGVWKTDRMAKMVYAGGFKRKVVASSFLGRYPANVIHDGSEEVESIFNSFGEKKSCMKGSKVKSEGKVFGSSRVQGNLPMDYGTASRFFYCAKASTKEKQGSSHPTQKPLSLIEYFAKMITPEGGYLLDPFMGSNTTGIIAQKLGFKYIGIEQDRAEFIGAINKTKHHLNLTSIM